MPKTPNVPEILTMGPFTSAAAEVAGVRADQLRRQDVWRRVYRDIYVCAGLPDSLDLRLAAARLLLPREAVVMGTTAAWLWGVDVIRRGDLRLEVCVPRLNRSLTQQPGLIVRQAELPDSDVTALAGLRVTTPLRTAFDIARMTSLVDAVTAVDALAHQQIVDLDELVRYTAAHRGWRGVRRVPMVVGHAEPRAESPMESRLRMLLVLAGLPRPEVQIPIRDRAGIVVARFDLGYPHQRVAIEYDGATHLDRRDRDNRRDNTAVLVSGERCVVLRYGALDYYRTPGMIVHQVRQALRQVLPADLRLTGA